MEKPEIDAAFTARPSSLWCRIIGTKLRMPSMTPSTLKPITQSTHRCRPAPAPVTIAVSRVRSSMATSLHWGAMIARSVCPASQGWRAAALA